MANVVCILSPNFNIHVKSEIAEANGKWTVHFVC